MNLLFLTCFRIVSSVAPILLSATAEAPKEFNWVPKIIGALVIGLLVGLIRTLVSKGKLTSVYKQDAATDYTKKDSFKVTISREIFMFSNTEKKEKPKPANGEN